MMMEVDDINEPPELEIHDQVATIKLLRPKYANRLSADDLHLIQAHLNTVNQADGVIVLRILSTGKYFCSGYDLKSFGSGKAPSSLLFGETVDLIEQARPITIAAVNGGVFGGGTDLALGCDFRLGVQSARMFMPAAKLGLHFYPGGLFRYASRLGVDQAKRLFLTACQIDADEMLRIGFLTQLLPDADLESGVQDLTLSLCAMAPLAILGIKKHLNLIARGELRAAEITEAVLKSEASLDFAEAASAWREKRPAKFVGR
jgi:enoyl-CoA hydratase